MQSLIVGLAHGRGLLKQEETAAKTINTTRTWNFTVRRACGLRLYALHFNEFHVDHFYVATSVQAVVEVVIGEGKLAWCWVKSSRCRLALGVTGVRFEGELWAERGLVSLCCLLNQKNPCVNSSALCCNRNKYTIGSSLGSSDSEKKFLEYSLAFFFWHNKMEQTWGWYLGNAVREQRCKLSLLENIWGRHTARLIWTYADHYTAHIIYNAAVALPTWFLDF